MASIATGAQPEPLRIVVFGGSNCAECEELKTLLLPPIIERHGDSVVVESVEIDTEEGFKRLLLFEREYNCPSDEAVRVFVGGTCLSGLSEIRDNLAAVVDAELALAVERRKSRGGAAAVLVPKPDQHNADADDMAQKRFDALRPGMVALAGLIDGVNPCAFATLVFFVSVLANLKRSSREILLVGVSFTVSVFLAYFLLGLGAFRVLKAFSVSSGVSRTLNVVVAALVFVLAAVSFNDYLKCRRGEAKGMTLKLPATARRLINRLITFRARRGHLVLWTFGLGFAISLLESMCTGQIYLPTIMIALNGGKANAFDALFMLFLYNVAFVIPLIIVFALAFWGVNSKTIAAWFDRNVALSKLLIAVLFLAMGLALLFFS